MEVLKRKVNASWRSILPIHPAFGELETIEQHLPKRQFKVLKAAEESERAIIGRLVRIATSGTTGTGGKDAP